MTHSTELGEAPVPAAPARASLGRLRQALSAVLIVLAFVPIYRLMDTSVDAPPPEGQRRGSGGDAPAGVVGHDRDCACGMAPRTLAADPSDSRDRTNSSDVAVETVGGHLRGRPRRDRPVVLSVGIGVAVGVQEDTIFFMTNHKFAGLSAKRLIYHGNQAVP